MTSAQIILLVYVVFLELGGIIGYVKAGSKASLIASSVFSALLLLFVFNVLPIPYHIAVMGFLIAFFGKRFFKSKKMMPNGMMLGLTILAVVLQLLLLL